MDNSLGLPVLSGRRILVVEDDYFIAAWLAESLEDLGATAPVAGSVKEALAHLGRGEPLDGAVLDINLGNEKVFPVADALRARRVPFVFATGYDKLVVPDPYVHVPRCEKPIDLDTLVGVLAEMFDRASAK